MPAWVAGPVNLSEPAAAAPALISPMGKAKVRVRISPSSDVIATWNPGIDGYALGQTHRNLRIARTYPFDIANGVYVEDLSIQYK